MARSEQEIISDITDHITKGGGGYRAWCAGISKDPRDRLFNGHGVHEKDDWWIYHPASSSTVARSIEAHFINLGTDGGTGGGDQGADCVYAYKKNVHTNP